MRSSLSRTPSPAALLLAAALGATACSSDPSDGVAAERAVIDQVIDIKVAGSPLLTFHVLSLATAQGPRLGVYAHNTGSRTINSATYVLRLRDHETGRGIIFEYLGMIGALATGAKSPVVKLDTGVVPTGADNWLMDRSDLLQVIRLDATSFVTSNPFSGLYHGNVNVPGGGSLSASGTIAFDGQTYLAIEGGLSVGGGANLIRGTLEPSGQFAGSVLRSDSLAVAVVSSGATGPFLATTGDGKLAGPLKVIAADSPPFDISLDLVRRGQ
jgi:hypothetical protein